MISILKDYADKKKRTWTIKIRELRDSDIVIVAELRKSCEQNYCGNYNKNWMCPPAVGKIDDLRLKLSKYSDGVVVQTIHEIADSFDMDGMTSAMISHSEDINEIRLLLEEKYTDLLCLSVGKCSICPECTYSSGEPCRYPDRALASVESYGINVNALLGNCGLEYNNGNNTVSYVGIFMK